MLVSIYFLQMIVAYKLNTITPLPTLLTQPITQQAAVGMDLADAENHGKSCVRHYLDY